MDGQRSAERMIILRRFWKRHSQLRCILAFLFNPYTYARYVPQADSVKSQSCCANVRAL